MVAHLRRMTAVGEPGRRRRACLCLLAVLGTASLVVMASCSSGSSVTSNPSQSAATTVLGAYHLRGRAHRPRRRHGQPGPGRAQRRLQQRSKYRCDRHRRASVRHRHRLGVVYTSDGYIMTNDHVITLGGAVSSGQSIVVTFSDGSQAPATLVGEDAAKDLAAIKVNKTGLNPVTFVKSSDVQLGEWATVIGSPLDFRNSVTLGIVSGLDRTLDVSATQTLTASPRSTRRSARVTRGVGVSTSRVISSACRRSIFPRAVPERRTSAS